MSFTPALLGFGTGLSLIAAIGAQNAFVLRQGIRRQHVVAVVLVCALSDAILIAAGVGGMGAVIQRHPEVARIATWAGAAFLIGYGLMAARRAIRAGNALTIDEEPANAPAAAVGASASLGTGPGGRHASPDSDPAPGTPLAAAPGAPTRPAAIRLWPVVLTCLAFTWLNPHVYLDTVVLLGSIAADHGESGKWVFGAGAMTASIVWFSALGWGARLLTGVFANPQAWRVLDAGVALMMFVLAGLLLF